jgi:hypothetical protein
MAKRADARVLVADVAETEHVLRSCLVGHRVTYVSTYAQALRALDTGEFDCALIGLHFADSHMFSLLHHLRHSERWSALPVLCIQGLPSGLSPPVAAIVRDTVDALDGRGVFEFDLTDAGIREACAAIDDVMAGVLGARSDKPRRQPGRPPGE